MTTVLPYSHPFRVADLAGRKPTRFTLVPDAGARARIAEDLGLIGLPQLTFKGELRPLGRHDWQLTATLDATVVQPCVVTLAPVTTVLHEEVARRYLADMPEPSGDEIEMPEDDTAEPLPAAIDAGEVLTEALALALPLYPRADGAEDGSLAVTEPGKAAMTDDEARPFANLAELMRRKPGTPG